MKKSRASFEDFLKQLSEVRFNLEVDRHVLNRGDREKLSPPTSEESRSKSPKRLSHPGGTGSDRVQTEKNRAYG